MLAPRPRVRVSGAVEIEAGLKVVRTPKPDVVGDERPHELHQILGLPDSFGEQGLAGDAGLPSMAPGVGEGLESLLEAGSMRLPEFKGRGIPQ